MPQQVSGDRIFLSTTEAVEKSGLSRVHIQRLLRSGQLEGVKLGHDWLVFEDSLLAFLAQPRKPGPKGPRKVPSSETSSANKNQNGERSTDNGSTP
jgi:excisionase family DNA binding protein